LLRFIPFGKTIIDKLNLSDRDTATSELLWKDPTANNFRVLGLVGEWFLNFGIWTFMIPYFIMAFILRGIRRSTSAISKDDARIILLPIIMVLAPDLILSDFITIMVAIL